MQMAGPRGLPASDRKRNHDQPTTLPPLQTNTFLRPETPNAGSGRSLAQQVLDVLSQPDAPTKSAAPRILPAWSRHAAFPFCSATESLVCHAFRRATFPQWPAAAT